MFFKKKLTLRISPSLKSKKVVNLTKNVEFTIVPERSSDNDYLFHLGDQKGEFEIKRILLRCLNGCNYKVKKELQYDAEKKTFKFRNYQYYNKITFEFEILASIEYKKVNYVEDIYSLYFPSKRLQMLDLFECEEIEIVLPKYSFMSFFCYFKKHENGVVEVHIVNPYNAKINGKKGDYIFETGEN